MTIRKINRRLLNRYSSPREFVWCLGVVIFLLMIVTAFIGYVLPWGQMSFWGATVITSLASAILYAVDLINFMINNGLELTLGNGPTATLPDLNIPLLPDPSPLPEIPLQSFPKIGIGSLSLDEQREVARLVRLEKGLITTATYVLKSLQYENVDPDEVKNVIQIWLLDVHSDEYENIRLALMNPNSSTLLEFLDTWEESRS